MACVQNCHVNVRNDMLKMEYFLMDRKSSFSHHPGTNINVIAYLDAKTYLTLIKMFSLGILYLSRLLHKENVKLNYIKI